MVHFAPQHWRQAGESSWDLWVRAWYCSLVNHSSLWSSQGTKYGVGGGVTSLNSSTELDWTVARMVLTRLWLHRLLLSGSLGSARPGGEGRGILSLRHNNSDWGREGGSEWGTIISNLEFRSGHYPALQYYYAARTIYILYRQARPATKQNKWEVLLLLLWKQSTLCFNEQQCL